MGYKEIFQEYNEEVRERYALVTERIASVRSCICPASKYRDYFVHTAEFICQADEILRQEAAGDRKSVV